MIWMALLLPLSGSVVNGLFGRILGKRVVSVIGCGTLLTSFLLLCNIPFNGSTHTLFSWISVGRFQFDITVYLDGLARLMGLMVTGVSFLIHVYSVGYMWEDPHYARYFSYLNLFVFFMVTLVFAGNLLLLFLGWEGVGLCSYLLISFWFQKKAAADAGKKAFIVNRIGDFGFLLGLFMLAQATGTLFIPKILAQASHHFAVAGASVTLITLLLFLGAVGKSAQFPLYVWLPDAMEGPTPVSALIHAATMVTAGVYLVARLFPLYQLAPVTLAIVTAAGLFTALFAATLAVVQDDIKKVLAYSTVSQLGYMFVALGVGAPVAAVFHLLTHAFFKALLFLGAGSVIHGLHGEQSLWNMGGLAKGLKWTMGTFVIAWLAILGVPPFSGAYSKEEILMAAFSFHPFIWLLLCVGVFLTSFYMTRLVVLTFFRKTAGRSVRKAHESPSVMLLPLCVLAFFALVSGWIGWGGEHSWIHGWLAPSFHLVQSAPHESPGWLVNSGSLLAICLGALLAWTWYREVHAEQEPKTTVGQFVKRTIKNGYFVEQFYQLIFVVFGKFFAHLLAVFDKGVIDGVVNGVAQVIQWGSDQIRAWQSGQVRGYALSFSLGVILVVGVLLISQGMIPWRGL